jgi:hypothetical protein
MFFCFSHSRGLDEKWPVSAALNENATRGALSSKDSANPSSPGLELVNMSAADTVATAVESVERAVASGNASRDALHSALRSCTAAFRTANDRETLKTVVTRDRAIAALVSLLPRVLGVLVRRQLSESMCVLLAAEGRALVPLLDALISTLTKACKETKVAGADSIKSNSLACMHALLERFGVLCAGRLADFYTLAKTCLKVGEDAGVRTTAVRVIVAGVWQVVCVFIQ